MRKTRGHRIIVGLALVLAIVLALPVLANAQPRPRMGQDRPGEPGQRGPMDGKFWKHPMVREALGLTDQQVERLEAIFLDNQKKLIDLKADVEKKALDLDALVADAHAGEKEIAAMIERVEDARARLGKARAMMLVQAREVLTPAQREKLEELRERRRMPPRERRDLRRRPGPPPEGGGPPPPEDDFGALD